MQRLLLPITVPFGALIGTIVIILLIGVLLLWVGDYRWEGSAVSPVDLIRLFLGDYPRAELHGGRHVWDLGLFEAAAPVVTALLVATAVLGGAALLARWGRRQG